jgi:hypothetical protein
MLCLGRNFLPSKFAVFSLKFAVFPPTTPQF